MRLLNHTFINAKQKRIYAYQESLFGHEPMLGSTTTEKPMEKREPNRDIPVFSSDSIYRMTSERVRSITQELQAIAKEKKAGKKKEEKEDATQMPLTKYLLLRQLGKLRRARYERKAQAGRIMYGDMSIPKAHEPKNTEIPLRRRV